MTIRPVSYSEILNADNAEELVREYKEECVVHHGEPQAEMYAGLEASGKLKCFGLFYANILVGFVSLLIGELPHHGNRLAAIESIFVLKGYREGGAADMLIEAAETCAGIAGCMALVATARKGSAFDLMLYRKPNWDLTHSQHTRML